LVPAVVVVVVVVVVVESEHTALNSVWVLA
jgi:hypothetical protein